MNKCLIQESDLARVLELLETHTFAQVAIMYGYESAATRNGGAAVRKFIQRQGVDPRKFTRKKGSRSQISISIFNTSTAYIENTPKMVRTYIENGIEIKVYESRHARF